MNNKRNKILAWVTGTLLLIALMAFLYYLIFLRPYVSTEDAYVNGDKIMVTSQINGRTISLIADNSDLVEMGQPIILLDPTDYDIQLSQAKSQLAQTVREVVRLKHQVDEARALLNVRLAELKLSEFDFQNRKDLIPIEAVSNEEVQTTSTDVQAKQEQVKIAQEQLQSLETLLGSGPIDKNPQIEVARKNVLNAYLARERCTVRAPITGYVAQRSVQVGEAVSPTRALLSIIPLDRMWVDANFKETELTDVRVGQPTEVTADIFGSGVVYKGVVIGMLPGTGGAFALLPPQNASGNWIKIVQRIPVRISLDPETLRKYPLRLGLSCTATVKVTDTSGPFFTEVPAQTPFSKTPIYEVSFKAIEEEIAKIIQDNLQ